MYVNEHIKPSGTSDKRQRHNYECPRVSSPNLDKMLQIGVKRIAHRPWRHCQFTHDVTQNEAKTPREEDGNALKGAFVERQPCGTAPADLCESWRQVRGASSRPSNQQRFRVVPLSPWGAWWSCGPVALIGRLHDRQARDPDPQGASPPFDRPGEIRGDPVPPSARVS
eukprot:scaffold803_cov367-Pavlova_lutheri.AAC.17